MRCRRLMTVITGHHHQRGAAARLMVDTDPLEQRLAQPSRFPCLEIVDQPFEITDASSAGRCQPVWLLYG